ncbi:PREDICTED: J domain-containing protein DDB_G0295729-like isoform X2 [Drosophila arizonae]|uniref:J domain-containing protein DDB_G0295729-like isoform X2 n=1 Tax=Drosophila arizonae TaxID=7263 RepID=A0ABM1PVZ1_DROAR|nr:PREDICTED: J domain-containing protein DDB_G0295729-like isoform X2 [Drosophila arizonae]
MTLEYFPRVFQCIMHLATSSEDFHSVLTRLENALKDKDELKKMRENLHKETPNLRIDMVLAREATDVRQEEIKQMETVAKTIQSSYEYLLETANLFDDEKIKNMLSFGVMRKEQEVQQKIKAIEMEQKLQLEGKVAMEARSIVQEFRKWQVQLKEAEEANSRIVLESAEMERYWSEKLARATQQRNKKIVSLVQLSKRITVMKIPVPSVTKVKACETKAMALPKKAEPLVLQPALDFINKYAEVNKVVDKAIAMDTSMEPPLRSILVLNRSMDSSNELEATANPNKQVHFAPLPSPDHTSGIEPLDLPTDMVDISDMTSESSQPEVENRLDPKNVPNKAVVEKVDVLPTLSFEIPSDLNGFDNLNYDNIFQCTESMPEEDMEEDKNQSETTNSNNNLNNNSNNSDKFKQQLL